MASKKELDAELLELRGAAGSQYRQHISSKIALYERLVETYFWWRKASQKQGYLDNLLEQEGIGYRKQLNRTNFNPIIRLIWKAQQRLQNVQISNWGSAINAIDDEYVRNKSNYQHDAVNELVSWIRDTGGLAAICGKKKEETEEWGYTPKTIKKETKSKKVTKVDERKQKRQLEVLSLRKRAAGGNKQTQKIDVGEVGTGEDNFVVLLAKSTGKGNELELVGTTAQQSIVDNALSNISDNNLFANAPASLRMLCEAIKLNTITRALHSYGARKNFYGKTTMAVKGDDKALLRENARLVLCKDGTILVSKTSSAASLVTHYIPSKKFLLTEDLWLRGADRFWLETELIHDGEIAIYDVTPAENLSEVKNKSLKASRQLTLTDSVTKNSRSIYFYDFSMVDTNTMNQPQIVADDIVFDWSIKANTSYFRRLYEHHFEGWQHRVKHRVHTPNNKVVAFKVGKDGITCEKKWDNEQETFTQKGARYFTAFGDDVVACGSGRILFAPTDIIQVLEMVSRYNVKKNTVEMSGNQHLIAIKFKNDLAEIRVYIPACSIKGKRDATYFTKFLADD